MIRTRGQKYFGVFNAVFMVTMACLMLYPFWYTIVYSLNNGLNSSLGGLYWWPREFTLHNYTTLFQAYNFVQAYIVTSARTVIGPVASIVVTLIMAYAMTTPELMFKKFYNVLIIIPMFFGGGLIPYFLLIKNLGLYNSFWVYIIPGLFAAWDFIMMRAYMNNLPQELPESARIDGANEFVIVFRIIFPLCVPICACLALFGAVGHWNSWFDSYIFNDRPELYTVQLTLKSVIEGLRRLLDLIEEQGRLAGVNMSPVQRQQMIDEVKKTGVTNEAVLAAASIVSVGPIIFLYPFLQKYFIKGMLIGSLKG